MKRILVKEEQLFKSFEGLKQNKYLLPNFIINHLKTHKTSLGDNPCFPFEGKYPYDYQILKTRYKEIIDSLGNLGLKVNNIEDAKNIFSKLFEQIKDLEKPIRDLLNDICRKEIKRILNVPEDTVLFQCHLVDAIENEKSPRILPEDDGEGNVDTFDDVDDIILTNNTILKRRFINSLIQGGSYMLCKNNSNIYDEIYNLESELPKLYEQIITLNDYILFNEEEKINEKKPFGSAYVEVNLGRMGHKTEIKSQALIFPFLIQESIRGFLELFASHGLPEDNAKAMYIIRHADFTMAEAYDMRFGVSLWNEICNDIEPLVLPYYFSELSQLPTDIFNKTIKEILSHTKRGNLEKQELISRCEREITFADLPQDFSDENIKSLISDDIEEDDYTLEELKEMTL